jgi:hypothetical protein
VLRHFEIDVTVDKNVDSFVAIVLDSELESWDGDVRLYDTHFCGLSAL